jgi:hypothetical protein
MQPAEWATASLRSLQFFVAMTPHFLIKYSFRLRLPRKVPNSGTNINSLWASSCCRPLRGLGICYRLFLGLTPQALCFRALRALILFLLSCLFSPVLAQQQPAIVEDKAIVLVGVQRLAAKVERAIAEEKRDEKATDARAEAKAEAELKQTLSPQATPEPTPTASELAAQVNNPAAPVTFVQFRDILFPNIPGTGGVTNLFQIQPVIPIHKSKRFPLLQLIKMTLPIASAPSPVSRTGLGDLQFFDLVSIKQKWGRWGFGPALVFPTATSKALGAGKWQAGPSFALIYTGAKNWTIGAVFQNPISFAGDKSRPQVNNLIITPTLTYNVPGYFVPGYWKHGWFVGLSDFNITFDWRNGGAGTIPLGPQIGRVFKIGEQPFSASLEAGGTVKHPAGTPNPGLIIGIEFSVIIKGHRKDQ